MDGYAVRAADVATVPARLKVIGEVAAGHPFAGHGRAGRGGAHLHRRRRAGGRRHRRDPGEHHARRRYRHRRLRRRARASMSAPRASISRRARCSCARASRLTDRDLALAAAMNHATLPVHRRPKVAVLATGDELVMPGADPGPGEIVYSNGFATMAILRREGMRAARSRHRARPDRRDRGGDAARARRRCDILVTSGGASVGDHDLVQKALASRRPRIVVLEDRHAARPADDARPAGRDACARACPAIRSPPTSAPCCSWCR